MTFAEITRYRRQKRRSFASHLMPHAHDLSLQERRRARLPILRQVH